MTYFLFAIWMVVRVAIVIYFVIMLVRLVRAVEKIARLLEKPTPTEQEQKQ